MYYVIIVKKSSVLGLYMMIFLICAIYLKGKNTVLITAGGTNKIRLLY